MSAEQKLWQSPHSFPKNFPSYIFVWKHKCVVFDAVTQNWKAKAKSQKMRWVENLFLALLLTNLNSALKPFASHASRTAATSKPSFTMSTEGDVFYVYVKRQFMSTVISADECLWKFLLGVLCCLGARCMIKAICKAQCVTLMCNRCPNRQRNVKLRLHTEGWNISKNCISAIVFCVLTYWLVVELVLVKLVVTIGVAASQWEACV